MTPLNQPFPDLAAMRSMPAWQPELGLARLDDDKELMGEIVELLKAALCERLEGMQSSAEQNDFDELRQYTHAQLPSLKILGFDQQATVFEAFEAAVVMADELTCKRLSPMVQKIWLDTIESLKQYSQSSALKSCE